MASVHCTGAIGVPGGRGAARTLPTAGDPCAETYDETTSVTVTRPKLGPMVIASYEFITCADSAPRGRQVSHVSCQDGRPVGCAPPTTTEVVTLGNEPAVRNQVWQLNGMNRVDSNGSVHFSGNEGISVIPHGPRPRPQVAPEKLTRTQAGGARPANGHGKRSRYGGAASRLRARTDPGATAGLGGRGLWNRTAGKTGHGSVTVGCNSKSPRSGWRCWRSQRSPQPRGD